MNSSKKYFDSSFTGTAFVNNIRVNTRNDDSGEEFVSVDIGVKRGEKSPESARVETERFSTIAVTEGCSTMAKAVMDAVDFTQSVKSKGAHDGRPVVSCTFVASDVRAETYERDGNAVPYLSGRLLKIHHVYIDGQRFDVDTEQATSGQRDSQEASVTDQHDQPESTSDETPEIRAFLDSIVDLDVVELDIKDPLFGDYILALQGAGYKPQDTVEVWSVTG